MLEPIRHLRLHSLQLVHIALHGQVAALVAVFLNEVLPDPLRAQSLVQPLLDERLVRRCCRGRAGNRVWPVLNRRRGLRRTPSRHRDRVRLRPGAPPSRVPRDRLPMHAQLPGDAAPAPAEFEKRLDLLL